MRSSAAARISERLRTARASARLRQNDVATSLNVSPTSLRQWEKGATLPAADKLLELCQLYGVSADYLLGIAEHPSGLPILRWIVDLDAVEAIEDATTKGELKPYTADDGGVAFAAECPCRPAVMGGAEFERLRAEVRKKIEVLKGRR